jgi:hypothetical protein
VDWCFDFCGVLKSSGKRALIFGLVESSGIVCHCFHHLD